METKKTKALSKSELANQYGITLKTLRGWLQGVPDLGVMPAQKIFTPKQVKKIFEHLGEP